MNSEPWPVEARWVENYQFVGNDDEGHAVTFDVPAASGGGGTGFSPRKMLLLALAACTGMDLVLLLRKQGQELTGLEVRATGQENPLFPHYFTEIDLKYLIRGRDLSPTLVEKAIRQSDEKYCSVGANLKDRSKIHTRFEIVEEAPAASRSASRT